MKKQLALYIDGYVLVVPKAKLPAYRKMAVGGAKSWMKHGALDYKECVGDDLSPEHVILTFPKMIKAKEGEVVIFSYITYKSKAHRNQVYAKVMKEMEKIYDKNTVMPFDMKRMAFGGFKVMVDGLA
jgi:alkaline phosphatase